MAFARAVNTMGLSLVMSFLGIYVVETRHYPAWLYGIIALVANLCQSWSNAWAGSLSDRIGRRPLITRALTVRAFVIAALGTQVMLDAPLWSLALNMVVSSSLRGCFEPVAYALVSDVCRDDQRIAAFGLQRMGTNLGWAIGPALGGMLTLVMPYGAIFYIAGAGMIVAAIVTLRVEDPVAARAQTSDYDFDLRAAVTEAWANPLVRMLLLGTFLCALLETQMFATMSIFLTDDVGLAKHDVGMLYTLNGIGVLTLQLPALALIRRWGLDRTLPWASIVDALGFMLIGFASGVFGGAIAIITLTCAEVIFDPAHQTAIAEVADPAHRGRTFGVVGFAQMVGIALAPLTGGILIDIFGKSGLSGHVAMWTLIACFGFGQTYCFAVFVRRRRRGAGRGAPAEMLAVPSSRSV